MKSPEFDCVLPEVLARAENLPSLPVAALELMRLANDERAGLDDYSRAIASDPILAARILALANSAPFRLGSKVTSLQRATMVLGMKTMQLMTLAFSLAGQWPRQGSSPSFDYRGFWKRSLCTAVSGRELGRIVGFTLAEESFLCGLSSYIGQLVMAECMTAEYEEVLQRSSAWPSCETEKKVLGFDSAEIGGALLKAWGLPAQLYLTIAHFAAPEELPVGSSSSTRKLCEIIQMAVLLGRVLCDEDKGAALRDLHARADGAGMTRGQIDALILSLEPRLEEAAELFSIDLGTTMSLDAILEEARRQATVEGTPRDDAEFGDREYLKAVLAREIENRVHGNVPDGLGILIVSVHELEFPTEDDGPCAAEEALRVLGRALRGSSRSSDALARFDERRFAVLVPICTPGGLWTFAGRIRARLGECFAQLGPAALPFGICVGGAHIGAVRGPSAGAGLLEAAQSALAVAAEQGPGAIEIRAV